jgi:hypothetical protein
MASRAADTAGSLTHTPHTQCFISQLELTVSSQKYLKELRILLFQRALYKLTNRDVLKKGNYYFFFYNNYICFKSLYAHDMVICFSAGFSYSVLMWPRFAVCTTGYHHSGSRKSGQPHNDIIPLFVCGPNHICS